jgi:hypothetical protein
LFFLSDILIPSRQNGKVNSRFDDIMPFLHLKMCKHLWYRLCRVNSCQLSSFRASVYQLL